MTITVNITGLEPIVEAVNKLAQAFGVKGLEVAVHDASGQAGAPSAPMAPVQQIPPQMPYYQAPPITPQQSAAPTAPGALPGQIPMGAAPQAPPTQAPPMQGQIPTTAVPQSYTQDQIAVAMTGLVDRGMQPVVMQILGQFGAMSLQQLPKEQYPALVGELRKAGANI